MKNNYSIILGVMLLLLQNQLLAFSPYEAFLHSGQPRQVGLLAILEEDNVPAFKDALASVMEDDCQSSLADNGISNLSAYSRKIGDRTWVVLHFILDGSRDYLGAAERFATAAPETMELSQVITPPQRAKRFGTRWLQMEWINYIRGKDVAGPAASRLMIVTTILPDKEEEYRTLHQTVWPGVVDQVARSNSRALCIFLA